MLKGVYFSFLISGFSLISADPPKVGRHERNQAVGILENIADVEIFDGKQRFALSSLYKNKPVILTLVFTTCTGICYPSLRNLKSHVSKLSNKDEFTVLALSFDPKDDAASMQLTRKSLSLENAPGWIFGKPKDIDKILKSARFNIQYDPVRKQYDHEAVLIGIDKQGKVIHKLTGMRSRHEFTGLLQALRGEFVPSMILPSPHVQISCFEYVPETGEYRVSWGTLLIFAPTLLTFFGIFFGAKLIRREK